MVLVAISTLGTYASAATTVCVLQVTGTGSSTGTPVSANVTFTYNDVTGLLTINIVNTSSTGTIVGAGFNTPGTRTATSGAITLQPTGGSMIAVNSAGGPFPSGSTGSYDFGLATAQSNPFQSGQVVQGINPGESSTGTFIISSPGGITALDFCSALNTSGNAVVLRFQAIAGDDSAHATNETEITPTPEPTTFLLLGAGLLALGLANRRKSA